MYLPENDKKKKTNYVPYQSLTSLCGLSPLKKDMAAPVNAMAVRAPTRPNPAHTSQPFCRLKGSLQSETID